MLRIGTVFTGIGAFEYMLKSRHIEHEILFACDCGDRKINITQEEFDELSKIPYPQKTVEAEKLYSKCKKENRIKETYLKNYDFSKGQWYSDIRFLDGSLYKNKIDIFVGGSPCQSFSLMGKRRGLEDTRGTLFYEYARLVNEIKPRVFIYENVPGMLIHDKGETWKTIQSVFDSLGYKIYWSILDASKYGMPQARKRLFVVGFLNGESHPFKFPAEQELNKKASDFYEDSIDPKFYLREKGFKFVTSPKNRGRAKINSEIIRTQKRNQQFNWNGDFVFEEYDKLSNEAKKQAYIGLYEGKKGAVRKLTPRECHRLMGFGDDFIYDTHDVDAYKQSGNSIVVNVLSELIDEILKVL